MGQGPVPGDCASPAACALWPGGFLMPPHPRQAPAPVPGRAGLRAPARSPCARLAVPGDPTRKTGLCPGVGRPPRSGWQGVGATHPTSRSFQGSFSSPGGASGVCRALGQTGDSLSSLCDRRWQRRHSSQHAHGRGPCPWLSTRAGPQGPRCAVASQQAACIRRPWPQPCPGGVRQAQGQPAPCHLCLKPPVASPAATAYPSCPTLGCLPLEARDLRGPAWPAWPPHQERAEGLAWTRASLAQRAPRTLPPAPCPLLPPVSSLPSIKCLPGTLSIRLTISAGELGPVLGEALFPWGMGTTRRGWGEGLPLRSRWGSRQNCGSGPGPAHVTRSPQVSQVA